jgi:ubiquinone/menaquinone biosynthesis C-methylase UbiE
MIPLTEADRKQIVRDHFHHVSRDWNDVYAGGDLQSIHIQLRQQLVLRFVEALGLPAGAQVLEVGCGTGRTTLELALRGFRVNALDFAPNMLNVARQNVRDRTAVSAHFMSADAEQLPIAGACVDLIVSMGVIGYVPQWQQALAEMFRAIRPGGHLIITCPNKWGLSHLVNPEPLKLGRLKTTLLGRKPRKTSGYALSTRHTPAQFDEALRDVGFEVLESATHTYGPFCPLGQNVLPESLSVKLHFFLQRMADRRRVPYLHRLGKHYIVVARKLAPAGHSGQRQARVSLDG